MTQSLEQEHREALSKLIEAWTRFGMVFEGFGKSWCRADRYLFLPDYFCRTVMAKAISI
ncbi:MAG: hypothetical protein WBA57_11560 [Elainellaceae cyanobacterium]